MSGVVVAVVKFIDVLFKKLVKDCSNKKSEEEFFKVDFVKKEFLVDYFENNKVFDKAFGDVIAKTSYFKEYMFMFFILKFGDKLYEMKF